MTSRSAWYAPGCDAIVLFLLTFPGEFGSVEEIRQWINGPRDYDQGAKLYLQHGHDHALRRALSEPASEFKKKMLLAAMKSLLTKTVKTEKEIEVTRTVAIQRTSAERSWPEVKDPTLEALHLKWKPLFAEMMSLAARIYDVALAGRKDPDKKIEAGRMAHRILDLDDRCDEIYRRRDHYLEQGVLPDQDEAGELVVDPLKIPVALENAKRYVRYYKNKLTKDPANENAAQKIKQYEGIVSQYQKMLSRE